MDTTILNLLFNYKGAITSREFRIGITLVIMSMGISVGIFLDGSLSTETVGKAGFSWLREFLLYDRVMHFFVPNLVPVSFVLSYSSFILAVKRVRMLTNNRILAVTSGVLSFLFFSSYMALLMLVMLMNTGTYMQYHVFALSLLLGVLFLIGGVNLVLLCIQKPSEPSIPSYTKGRLDISGYAIKLGKLMGIAAVVSVVISAIIFSFGGVNWFYPVTSFALGGCAIVVLFFYLRYSVFRLRDAGIPVLWLVCILVAYLALFGLKIWLNLYHTSYLTLCSNTIFSIASSFLTLAQCVLFLLPTRSVSQTSTADNN